MTVSVESFPRDNLDEGVQLYRAVFNEPPWEDDWTDETARRRLSQIIETPGYRGYGASVRGELVGLVMGNLEQWYTGEHFYLKEMCVCPSQQRHGIGTTLIAHLIETLQKESVERVYLLTMQESPARAFYENNGFRLDEQMGMQSLQIEP
ncbi:GNAT family N-acetyltransferase [Halalkalicoccus jeotgali]|uniref:GNAT family acetyltransferase n=1 Tax=Halalkalicoccus jeotgali (strain DSM 18796 / CECT 7217 / JCM 14584 / KCTC 4019 / B3) TaxID=795797 RepID=D8JCI2_HALJB|nr:GNAT family N-acetyltransferase [Halalkalicoccus jeotgali]ADJ17089.1 GNAT family acetyltransferase [Halalkalicoccus jeotgali B3]ELY41755.1 GNAT family acetyltransferase [Halalkalicoccus jeotgali B3]